MAEDIKNNVENVIDSIIQDVQTETLVVASFYANPDLFLDYNEVIVEKYDFYHDTTRFLYNSIKEIYYYHTSGATGTKSTRIDEVKVNIYMNEDEERAKKWKKLKGYSYIERIMRISDLEDFEEYFNKLKKYSLLRELERKGFPAQKLLKKKNFDAASADDIVNFMERELLNIGTKIGGLEDSVILGRDMLQVVEKWREKPDFGIDIPFDTINNLIRGWRKKKLMLLGLHSGCGKSRISSKIVCFVGIYLQTPILVMVNEQDKDEWDAMILSSVINNKEFHTEENGIGKLMKKYRIDGIDETKIVTATYNEREGEIITLAAQFIEDNSCIHFMVLGKFDEPTIKRQIKRHKIRNKCEYYLYDTLKAPDHDWQGFVKTGDTLKSICMELDMGGMGTFQLTDDSLFDEILTSQAIANGKHIKHIADHLFMAKPLPRQDYEKYKILKPEDELNDSRIVDFEIKFDYYILFMDKNRGGKDKDKIILQVNKGRNMWIEEGLCVESDNQKEHRELKKEFGRLKKEKEVRNMKTALGK